MILPVLIDNCVVLFVKVNALLLFSTDINNLKQTNTTFMNLRGAVICFILCDTILSSKVFSRFENLVLIE